MKAPKTRNANTWTEATFNSSIKSALRKMTMYWQPIKDCKNAARVERGKYLCAGCKAIVPASIKVVQKGGKNKGKVRRKAAFAIDHIEPIVSVNGFNGWDEYIERMFCEDGFQLLCLDCHSKKTKAENEERNRLTKT